MSANRLDPTSPDAAESAPIDIQWLLAQGRWMRSLARDLLGDRALAEDVVQDAWTAALAQGPRSTDPGAGGTRAWLAGVVGNLARRVRGREARRSAIEQRGARPEAQASASELVARMEMQRELAGAVLALTEPYRSAVLWRHLEGLSAGEIGRRQGCSDATARQHVARGLAQLRQSLDARHGRRSAWALVLAPLAHDAPGIIPAALSLGGLLMGSKLIVLSVAGLSLAALTIVFLSERTLEDREPAVEASVAVHAPAHEAEARAALAPAPVGVREPSAASGTATSPVPLVLTGRVQASSGWPLARANVVHAADESEAEQLPNRGLSDERWAVTDELGRFRLHGADPEPMVLWISCNGYLTERIETRGLEPMEVTLRALPRVEIVLHDPDGETLASDAATEVKLWIRLADGSEEILDVSPGFTGVSPDATGGRLVSHGLPVGRLERVRARRRGFGRAERALDLVLEPDRDVLVEVELPRGATLHGIVLDARTEQPIAGADVWAEEGWLTPGNSAPSTQTDEHGRFELLGVELSTPADGSAIAWCLVSAQAKGFVAQRFDMRGWQRNPEERYRAEMRLEPADSCLRGRALLPDGRPADAFILGVDARSELHVVWSDDTGAFLMDGLPEGALELLLLTRETSAERASLRATRTFACGEDQAAEFTLEACRGVVRGRLHDSDGAPIVGAELLLNHHLVTPGMTFGAEQRETRTDATGRYEFADCPPGQHHLRVGAMPDGFVAEPSPSNFQLAVGETRAVDLVCAPSIELGGWVDLAGRDFDGDGAVSIDPARLRVVAFTAEGGANLAESVVAADGAFRFPGLYPTEIELVVLEGDEELSRTRAGPQDSRELLLPAHP